MLLWGAGEEAGGLQAQAVLGLCPKGLPCCRATILTEARLDTLRARPPLPHSPLWLLTGSSFLLLPKFLPASGCSSK